MLPTLRTLTLPALSPDVRGFPTFHYVTSLHVADTTETNVSLLGYFPSLTSLTVYREMSMPAVLELLDVLRTMPRIRRTGFALDAKELEGKALRQLGEKIALLEARGVQTVSVLEEGECAKLRRLVRKFKWLAEDIKNSKRHG